MIEEIKETYRQRQALLNAEKSLTLQIKAIQRRLKVCDDSGAATAEFAALPLLQARETIHKAKLGVERQLKKLAKQVPQSAFIDDIHGAGILGFAQIVGEAGDLSKYANPAKLWKRMGLAVINGKSQRRVKGDAAIEQGYCPKRRAVMHVIGDALIKKQNKYRELYLERKKFEREKEPDFSDMHTHLRAMRYMEKRYLKDLWRYWHQNHWSNDIHRASVDASNAA